jgi:thiosulfate/3-mercaptopyruvate sulfurtransferase
MSAGTKSRRAQLVSADELLARLGAPGLALFDATSTYAGGPTPRLEGHIPGALRLDIDALSDRTSALPHMLPSAADFQAFARATGVTHAGEVVVYDRMGVVGAPRAWWMFRVMGHPRVAVLDGGLPAWAEAGGAIAPGPAPNPAAGRPKNLGDFTARLNTRLLADRGQVAAALASGRAQVLDVRSAARFAGGAPEPRPGVRSGHMPGALNAPWAELVTAEGRLASKDALEAALTRAGVALDRRVITSCGSGVTACIAALALESLGRRDWALYDGSWAEWGSRADTPIVRDEAVP